VWLASLVKQTIVLLHAPREQQECWIWVDGDGDGDRRDFCRVKWLKPKHSWTMSEEHGQQRRVSGGCEWWVGEHLLTFYSVGSYSYTRFTGVLNGGALW
jgi:hypothetical protein